MSFLVLLVVLLLLASLCIVSVSVLWLTVPLVGLRCVTVVFPDHTHLHFNIKLNIKSKKEGNDLGSIQSSTTPDPGHHLGKYKYTIKHHTQESQEIGTFPAGDHMATVNRQENTTNTKHK